MTTVKAILTRLHEDERGASAVLVAILLVILFGFTALAIDVARMYEERRELQRTADVAAISGAQVLMGSKAAAAGTAEFYIDENPSVHHGAYDAETDVISVQRIADGDPGCAIDGQNYDCVEVTVRARQFDFLFAGVLGFDGLYFDEDADEAIGARATAIVGAGAPAGEKLVPWLLVDCPIVGLDGGPGDTASYDEIVAAVEAKYPGRCPYEFSTAGWAGPRTELFLDSGNNVSGNFQGAVMSAEPCPPPATNDGLFPISGSSGGSAYSDFLAGEASPDMVPCSIAKGARIHPKTGAMVGPTRQGLIARGTSGCLNETSFNATLQDPDGDGIFQILDHHNPCLLAVVLAVQSDPNNPAVNTDVPGGTRVAEFQHPDALGLATDRDWRFALPIGASKTMVVRRFGFFYITELGSARRPYRGVFLRAVDSGNSGVTGSPCTEIDGICAIKLTLPQ